MNNKFYKKFYFYLLTICCAANATDCTKEDIYTSKIIKSSNFAKSDIYPSKIPQSFQSGKINYSPSSVLGMETNKIDYRNIEKLVLSDLYNLSIGETGNSCNNFMCVIAKREDQDRFKVQSVWKK